MSEDKSGYRPTREAVFTETMQIGIVVRDLEATIARYVKDYGIGPWQVDEFDPVTAKDMHEYGQPVMVNRSSTRRAAPSPASQPPWSAESCGS